MNASDQLRLLQRIEAQLDDALTAARQLPGTKPLIRKLRDAQSLVDAWRSDQEHEVHDDAS